MNAFGVFFAFIGNVIGKFSVVGRIFLVTIFLGALFVILFNLGCDLLQSLITWAVNKVSFIVFDNISSISGFNVTGPASWILQMFKIPEIISLVLSSYTIRVSLKLVPFIKVN